MRKSGCLLRFYRLIRNQSRGPGTVVGANGTILRTTDGGAIWIPQYSGVTNSLRSVFFDSSSYYGTAVGDGSTILRTTNGGTNWSSQISGIYEWLTGVSFTDINNETIVGENGKILETTNGGANWNQQTSGTSNSLNAISILAPRLGLIYDAFTVGAQGRILKKTFGNYTSLNSGTNNNLYSVSFADSNHATTVGQDGTILRTTNGGANWNPQFSGTNYVYYGVSFTDSNYGSVIGANGTILRTTNGGTNWNPQYSGTNVNLYGVYFTDNYTGTAIGANGTILRTTNGGIGVKQISSEIPEKYSLYQNFPNPFNPITKIKFDIPVTSYVKFTIFDLSGREAAVLVNEEKKAGSYQADWDASNFSSGIYFYKIETKNFIKTKKMILVK